jgi:hypothetical protein
MGFHPIDGGMPGLCRKGFHYIDGAVPGCFSLICRLAQIPNAAQKPVGAGLLADPVYLP